MELWDVKYDQGNPGRRGIKLINNTVMKAIQLFDGLDKPRIENSPFVHTGITISI